MVEGFREIYLGDAVYAPFDGYQIRLRTGDGSNNVIYLEPSTFSELVSFAETLKVPIDE